MSETENEILTVNELLLKYPFSRQTLWRMEKNGLPFYRANSRKFYKTSEVEAFMRRQAAPLSEYAVAA